MRKRMLPMAAVIMAAALAMTACGADAGAKSEVQQGTEAVAVVPGDSKEAVSALASPESKYENLVKIVLSDDAVTVDGENASKEAGNAVYLSNDIIYYEDRDQYDSGNTYGEGEAGDKHTAQEAAGHTVVNITEPGTYYLTGKLSAGQIFVNVGEEEKDKVTLILDGVDITCTVAPAVMFYEVYECDADASEETASKDVDTSNAGAKVIIVDGSVNNVTGSYVARIYKDSAEEKKLHKYDGAFYSKMSMEIAGEEAGTGVLNITAENEGLDTEMHLTINGGNINITSLNDGINVNEDGVSVCTINGGTLNIQTLDGEEGDGIDSNGWLVINGGTVVAYANPKSQDAGIDSDMGIYINGGTVIGCGNMYDTIEAESAADTMIFQFSTNAKGLIVITDENDAPVIAFDCKENYTNAVVSSELLTEGTYHVYSGGTITGTAENGVYTSITSYTGGTQLAYTGSGMEMGGRPDMSGMPEGMEGMGGRPDMEGMRGEVPGGEIPSGGMPDGEMPSGEMPNGGMPGGEMPSGEIPSGGMPGGEMPSGEIPSGGMPDGGMPSGEMPGGAMPNGDMRGGFGAGNRGEGQSMPALEEGQTMPDFSQMGNRGDGNKMDFGKDGDKGQMFESGEKNTEFIISSGVNFFGGVTTAE